MAANNRAMIRAHHGNLRARMVKARRKTLGMDLPRALSVCAHHCTRIVLRKRHRVKYRGTLLAVMNAAIVEYRIRRQITTRKGGRIPPRVIQPYHHNGTDREGEPHVRLIVLKSRLRTLLVDLHRVGVFCQHLTYTSKNIPCLHLLVMQICGCLAMETRSTQMSQTT